MNGIRRAIIERLGRINECGGSSGGGYGSSSYGGSYGEPRRERPARKTSVIKDMTVELYTQADRQAELVDAFYEACRKSGKPIPAELRAKLDAIKRAAKDYIGLVDFYTGD